MLKLRLYMQNKSHLRSGPSTTETLCGPWAHLRKTCTNHDRPTVGAEENHEGMGCEAQEPWWGEHREREEHRKEKREQSDRAGA